MDEKRYLDAIDSDPVRMGWMAGSPPPPDKLIRFADSSFARFPRTRWSYSNMRQLLPTSAVQRAGRPVRELPRDERGDLDAVTFVPLGGGGEMTWGESLLANYTDGLLILHRGTIVYERYFGVLDAHTPHIAYLGHEVVRRHAGRDARARGPHRRASHSAAVFAGAGVERLCRRHDPQLLDMTTGLHFVEDYTDPNCSIWQFSRAGGFRPRPPGYQGPESFYDFIRTVAEGARTASASPTRPSTPTRSAWVLRRVTGRSLTELMPERFWSRLGVEEDAYFMVDSTGVEFAGGGFNLTLRDMARFGEMMRLGGRFNDQQIVPGEVVDDIRRGGSHAHFAKAGYTLLPGWSYRSMWWVSHNEHGAFTARGIHGQAIYVDPAAEMVIARFASHPLAANVNLDPVSLPAYHAMATFLMRG